MSKFIRSPLKSLAFLLLTMSFPLTAGASVITIYDTTSTWVTDGNSGGGSSAITATEARSGNGSAELYGDRTRFVMGNPYNTTGALGSLSALAGASFNWMIANDSAGNLHEDYSPALRLHIRDGSSFYELIWEAAYNGLYGSVDNGVWNTSGAGDNFWMWEVGVGDALIYNRSVADWINLYFSSEAMVTAISVGVGSSAGSGYHAFADNVTLHFVGGDSTTFNFEVERVEEVPAPSALLLMGLGLAALRLRRKS